MLAGPVVGVRAASSIEVQLTAISGSSLAQGVAYAFDVLATNAGPSSQQVEVHVRLTSPRGATEDIRSLRATIPAGGSTTWHASEVSSQWFVETGSFSLVGMVGGQVNGNTLTYAVSAPTVVVPVFRQATASVGMNTALPTDANTSHSAGACWGDVNRDGYPDLYVPIRDRPAQLWIYQ